ncbi:hypothetical protein AGMMS4952_12730 [Spirochaetia bacterium]|nr:hypothetical protein AGMMS4952_12730 [Spirochaetia bacterium]
MTVAIGLYGDTKPAGRTDTVPHYADIAAKNIEMDKSPGCAHLKKPRQVS